MLSQVRAGAIDFFTISPEVLGTLVSAGQISGVGFAFRDYNQVWAAMDGELGAHVRKQIAGIGEKECAAIPSTCGRTHHLQRVARPAGSACLFLFF